MKHTLSILFMTFCLLGSLAADNDNIFGKSDNNSTRWSPVKSDASITSSRTGNDRDFTYRRGEGGTTVAPQSGQSYSTDRFSRSSAMRNGSSAASSTHYGSNNSGRYATNTSFSSDDNANFVNNEFFDDGEDDGMSGPQRIRRGTQLADTYRPDGPIGDAILPLSLMLLAFGVWKYRKMHW